MPNASFVGALNTLYHPEKELLNDPQKKLIPDLGQYSIVKKKGKDGGQNTDIE